MIDLKDRKCVVLGCGAVGKCLVHYIHRFFKINHKQIYIVDKSADTKNFPPVLKAIEKGATFVHYNILHTNVVRLFDKVLQLKEGDIVIDVTTLVDTIKIFCECRKRSIHYINTDTYNVDGEHECNDLNTCVLDESIYLYQQKMKDAIHKTRRHGNTTSVLTSAANPGLISLFTKQGMLDIAKHVLAKQKEVGKKVDEVLKSLLKKEDYAGLGQHLMIRTIHCSEIDTQVAKTPSAQAQSAQFRNTWSAVGFVDEGMDPCQLVIGTHEKFLPLKSSDVHRPIKQVALLRKEGRKVTFKSYVPESIIDGKVKFTEIVGVSVPHDEQITLNDYLANEDYSPSMYYVYRGYHEAFDTLCNAPSSSLGKVLENDKMWKVLNVHEDGLEGYDNLGALFILERNPITGENKPWGWWTGSILDTSYTKNVLKDPFFGPTVIQVMAGMLSGLSWAINHPNKGVINPEDIDMKYVLGKAKKYLGVMYSGEVTDVDIAGYSVDALLVSPRHPTQRTKLVMD